MVTGKEPPFVYLCLKLVNVHERTHCWKNYFKNLFKEFHLWLHFLNTALNLFLLTFLRKPPSCFNKTWNCQWTKPPGGFSASTHIVTSRSDHTVIHFSRAERAIKTCSANIKLYTGYLDTSEILILAVNDYIPLNQTTHLRAWNLYKRCLNRGRLSLTQICFLYL